MPQTPSSNKSQDQKQQKKTPISSNSNFLPGSDTEDEKSVYSPVIFNKELAQSSLLSDEFIQRSASQFGIRPITLFDSLDIPTKGILQSQHILPQQLTQRHFSRQNCSLPRPKLPPNVQQKPDSDSEGEEDEYKFLVRHLQKENEQLLIALQRNHNTLLQCRQDKRLLEELIQDQRKLTLDKELEDWMDGSIHTSSEKYSKTDMLALVEQVEQRQRRDARHRDDLLFQKRYLLLANAALESW
ncbi:hypothetical protein BC941DRAFT_442796 [Chlamydoabsidia padenii]|nr:hypothetical protein BC941DRAFT_442796 [Chlamydoabsidia padenii]